MTDKSDLIQEVARLIAELQEATQSVDEAAADYLGVNLTDLRCLGLIGRRPMTLGELAVATSRTPAAITTAVDRLTGAGLARRTPDAKDRRRILVQPTELAFSEIATIWGPIGEEGTSLLADYSAQQLRLLQAFLQRGIRLQEEHAARLNNLTPRSRQQASEL